MYNKVVLVGRLTKDPELKYLESGSAVATLSMAVNSKLGADKEEVLFIDAVSFGKQAEACGSYLHKGSLILVDGRLKTRSWESDGKKHYKTEIMANQVTFMPSANKDKKHAQDQEVGGRDDGMHEHIDDPF